jgi:hypothetical protein
MGQFSVEKSVAPGSVLSGNQHYGKLMNSLSPDEAVVFVDAVHPTHAARAAGCWAAKDEKLAIEQTTGRQRLNIHGALDLETGQTKMIEAEAIRIRHAISRHWRGTAHPLTRFGRVVVQPTMDNVARLSYIVRDRRGSKPWRRQHSCGHGLTKT